MELGRSGSAAKLRVLAAFRFGGSSIFAPSPKPSGAVDGDGAAAFLVNRNADVGAVDGDGAADFLVNRGAVVGVSFDPQAVVDVVFLDCSDEGSGLNGYAGVDCDSVVVVVDDGKASEPVLVFAIGIRPLSILSASPLLSD